MDVSSQPRAQGRNEEGFSRFARNDGRAAAVAAGYSIRRALMGEMEAARLAGMMAAKKEQIASAPAAAVKASGSEEETP